MVDRALLRLSAMLQFVGVLLSFLAGILHPARENANEHVAVFAEYANSTNWTAIHLGQFAGMAVFIAGLLVLFFALDFQSGTPRWAGRFGFVSAVVALALHGVLQAVDGGALKQAVDAWVSAPDAEKAARLASAEAIRWLEWGVRSYQSFMLGLAFVLFATMIVSTARIPKPIGHLWGCPASPTSRRAGCLVLRASRQPIKPPRYSELSLPLRGASGFSSLPGGWRSQSKPLPDEQSKAQRQAGNERDAAQSPTRDTHASSGRKLGRGVSRDAPPPCPACNPPSTRRNRGRTRRAPAGCSPRALPSSACTGSMCPAGRA